MKAASQAGFTLLETLVTLVIVGFIGVTLTGLINFSQRMQKQIEASREIAEDIAGSGLIFRSIIERAIAFLPGNVVQRTTRGEEKSLNIWSLGPPILAFGEPRRFHLRAKNINGKEVLVVSWQRSSGEIEQTEVILQDLANLSFEYYATLYDKNISGPIWRSTLPEGNFQLHAVRMKVRPQGRKADTQFTYSIISELPLECISVRGRLGCP